MFVVLLTSIVDAYNNTMCISLSNQQCKAQPTFINVHSNELTKGLRYCTFAVNFYRCVGSCDTLDDLSNKVSFPNNTEVLILHVFNVIIVTNESKPLTKHISFECTCIFDGK